MVTMAGWEGNPVSLNRTGKDAVAAHPYGTGTVAIWGKTVPFAKQRMLNVNNMASIRRILNN